jgi:shikimate kinase
MIPSSSSDAFPLPPASGADTVMGASTLVQSVRVALQQHPSQKGMKLILTGFMGCGKSTLGRKLAQTLGVAFLDTDKQIEKETHQKIPDIFSLYGEAHFRTIEHQVLAGCLEQPQCVVATGGGALVEQTNLNLALQAGWVIYIDMPPEQLLERVLFSPKDRPLIDVPNPEEVFYQRFEERLPFYQQSHITVQTANMKPEQAVEQVLLALHSFLTQS